MVLVLVLARVRVLTPTSLDWYSVFSGLPILRAGVSPIAGWMDVSQRLESKNMRCSSKGEEV